jgi:hypothetical protein
MKERQKNSNIYLMHKHIVSLLVVVSFSNDFCRFGDLKKNDKYETILTEQLDSHVLSILKTDAKTIKRREREKI